MEDEIKELLFSKNLVFRQEGDTFVLKMEGDLE